MNDEEFFRDDDHFFCWAEQRAKMVSVSGVDFAKHLAEEIKRPECDDAVELAMMACAFILDVFEHCEQRDGIFYWIHDYRCMKQLPQINSFLANE